MYISSLEWSSPGHRAADANCVGLVGGVAHIDGGPQPEATGRSARSAAVVFAVLLSAGGTGTGAMLFAAGDGVGTVLCAGGLVTTTAL